MKLMFTIAVGVIVAVGCRMTHKPQQQEQPDPMVYRPLPGYICNREYCLYQDPEVGVVRLSVRGDELVLVETYSKFLALSKNGVYYRGEFIACDTTTFEYILEGSDIDSFVWKNRDGVYCGRKKLDVADPETFDHFRYGYIRDKYHLYKDGEIVTCNGVPVEVVGGDFYRVADTVFTHGSKPIKMVDGATFKALSGSYYVDKNRAYYYDYHTLSILPIRKEHLKDIRIWSYYISDGRSVWFYDDLVKPKVDAATFGILSYRYTKTNRFTTFFDKTGIYYTDIPLYGSEQDTIPIDSLRIRHAKDGTVGFVTTHLGKWLNPGKISPGDSHEMAQEANSRWCFWSKPE